MAKLASASFSGEGVAATVMSLIVIGPDITDSAARRPDC
jgi:hypothetical protein